jgi:hypothetical protein
LLVVDASRREEAAVVEAAAPQLLARPLLIWQPDAVVRSHDTPEEGLRRLRAQHQAAASPELREAALGLRADVLGPTIIVCVALPRELDRVGHRVHHPANAGRVRRRA